MESYLATVVLDLLVVSGEADLYESAANDFKAVKIFFTAGAVILSMVAASNM